MEAEILKTALRFLSLLISLLTLACVWAMSAGFRMEKAARIYKRINNRLKEQKNGWFDYQRTQLWLEKMGASWHLGKWVDPVRFLALRLVFAATGALLGSIYHLLAALLLAAAGFLLPMGYLIYANRKDNDRMLPELKLVYNALAVQIRSGVYVTDALVECCLSVKDKRLRSALLELSGSIIMKSDILEALERFEDRFSNRQVDSLCVILRQAMESGQAVEMLSDIAGQIKDMEAALMLKKKGRLDRHTTFYLLGIMCAVLGVVLYACITQMFQSAASF